MKTLLVAISTLLLSSSAFAGGTYYCGGHMVEGSFMKISLHDGADANAFCRSAGGMRADYCSGSFAENYSVERVFSGQGWMNPSVINGAWDFVEIHGFSATGERHVVRLYETRIGRTAEGWHVFPADFISPVGAQFANLDGELVEGEPVCMQIDPTTAVDEMFARWNKHGADTQVTDPNLGLVNFAWNEWRDFPHPTYRGGSYVVYMAFADVLVRFLESSENQLFLQSNELAHRRFVYGPTAPDQHGESLCEIVKEFRQRDTRLIPLYDAVCN